MITERLYDPYRIAYWLLRCDNEAGHNDIDPSKVYDYVHSLLQGGRCIFLEIADRGFAGLIIEDTPYWEITGTPFGLVSTGPGILRKLLKDLEILGRMYGCTRFRLHAGSEKLLKFYKRNYDWRDEYHGTGLVTGRLICQQRHQQ